MNNNFMQTSNLLQRKTKEYKFSGAFKQLFLIFIILIPSAMYSGTSVHGYVVNAESYYLSANDIYVIPESARPVVIHGWGTDKYYNGRQWIPTDGHGELYINGYCVVSDTKEFTYNLNANIGQVYNIKYVCFWYGSGKDLGATFRIVVVS